MNSFRVRRYHTENVIHDETVGEHTAGVLGLCLVLTNGKATRNLLLHALFHDFGEKYTGDVPFPFKRDHPEIKEKFDAAEDQYLSQANIQLPQITEDEKKIMKAADMFQLCFKAKRELAMGNSLALPILENGVSYLRMLQWPSGTVFSNLLEYVTS
jgi:5'-deoxynucleotidase YfbR-like HD superfamily hydrolase